MPADTAYTVAVKIDLANAVNKNPDLSNTEKAAVKIFEDPASAVITIVRAESDNIVVELRNTAVAETGSVQLTTVVTGPQRHQVPQDHVFQVKLSWTAADGTAQERLAEVSAETPVKIDGLPLQTLITATEVGSAPLAGVQWGDIIWSASAGATVVDNPAPASDATVTLTGQPGDIAELTLENRTQTDGVIILPLPIPLPHQLGALAPAQPGPAGTAKHPSGFNQTTPGIQSRCREQRTGTDNANTEFL